MENEVTSKYGIIGFIISLVLLLYLILSYTSLILNSFNIFLSSLFPYSFLVIPLIILIVPLFLCLYQQKIKKTKLARAGWIISIIQILFLLLDISQIFVRNL